MEHEFRRQFLLAAVALAAGGGSTVFALSYLLPVRRPLRTRRERAKIGVAGILVLGMTCTVAWVQLAESDSAGGPEEGNYALAVLDETLADGSTTDSPVLLALLGGALNKAQVLVERQEQQERDYRDLAEQGLIDQAPLMTGPRDGEVAVMMQSDMHCNTTMIRLQSQIFSTLRERFGEAVPSLLAITGDLTTNGTAAEGVCVRDEAAITDGGPIAAVTGNHESDVSEQQMDEAGMTVLDGSTEEIGGVRVLGDGDPSRSELFGETRPRGEETQAGLGERLAAEAADGDRPDLVLVHEAYAAQAFLDIESVDALMQSEPESLTEPPDDPADDTVDDVPTSAVFYGHWHRSIEPRVLWNSDGTWTLLMELDTTGGAIDSPTINNFSTPWSQPAQEASFPVVFLDEESRLVTGYQLYSFDTNGAVVVSPRVDVGLL